MTAPQSLHRPWGVIRTIANVRRFLPPSEASHRGKQRGAGLGMDTALCWKAFEDDFIWLHGKSEDGLRAEGGRKGDDDKWRCQLAAAIFSLQPGNEGVMPTAALRHYGCEKPSSGDQNKVRELQSAIPSMPNWQSVVASPPSAPRARQCLAANQRELQQAGQAAGPTQVFSPHELLNRPRNLMRSALRTGAAAAKSGLSSID